MHSGYRLYAGTRKGLFVFRSDAGRLGWQIEGPLMEGWTVSHCIEDPRDSDRVYAAASHPVWGPRLARSRDGGRTWDEAGSTPAFPPGEDAVKAVWTVQPGHAERPGEVWAGVEPAALFRSDDWGESWQPIAALNGHETRSTWMAGGGGLILHGIVPDPSATNSLIVTISAGGAYRSDDAGDSWRPVNRGVRADFSPDPLPESGQCVHHLVRSPVEPSWLFQQNHCGEYASDDDGETWQDVGEGLPSRFGFAAAVHPRARRTVYVAPLHSDMLRAFPDGAMAVWRSRDGGANWEPLRRGLPQDHAYLSTYRMGMAADRADPAGLYVATATGQIFFSTDEGDCWELMADFLPPVLSLEVAGEAS